MKLITTILILTFSLCVTSCSDSKYEGPKEPTDIMTFDEAVANSIENNNSEPKVILSTRLLKNVVIRDIKVGDHLEIRGNAHRVRANFKTNHLRKKRLAVEEYRCERGDTCYDEITITCNITTRERLEDIKEVVNLMQEDAVKLIANSKELNLKNLIKYGDFEQDERGDFSLKFQVEEFMLNDSGVIKIKVENVLKSSSIIIGQTNESCPGVHGNGGLGRYHNYRPQRTFINYEDGVSIKAEIRKL